MKAFFPSFLRRCITFMTLMMIALLYINPSRAEDEIIIGVLDGTRKLGINEIKSGFNVNEKNHIDACMNHDAYNDNFVLTIEMGEFKDHLIPRKGVNLCGLLTSTAAEGKYVYAPKDPRTPGWDGHTTPVIPPLYNKALGGSAEGFVTADRSTLSFWGDNSDNVNHTGGCCALKSGHKAAWFRPYRLLLTKMPPAMYLAWGVEPSLAVTDGPVVFEVIVWNMRSEPHNDAVEFTIVINGKSTTVERKTGRYTHYGDHPGAQDTKYTITVSLTKGPDTANTRELKSEVTVMGKFPEDVQPCGKENIPKLIHFGPKGAAIGPLNVQVAMEEDLFAPTVVGGEYQIRPVTGHFNTAQAPKLPPTKYSWENVSAPDGLFKADVPCNGVQYYAFSVYSAVAQRIVLHYGYDRAAVVYFGGKRFVPNYAKGEREGSFVVQVTKGYHQVLVKMFSEGSAKGSETCITPSEFWIRAVGTGVGYTHAVMSDIPEGAYELWSNQYMTYLLHLGETREEYLYGGLDEDFIDIRNAAPQRGSKSAGKTWKVLFFADGRVPVYGERIPQDKEVAVKYLSFSIYNGYDSSVPVRWTFITGGKTDFFVDGIVAYSRPSGGGDKNESFATSLSSGWHQVIARVAATRDQLWIFTYYIHFDNYRLGGSMGTGTSLPFGLSPVRPGIPIPSLMELVDTSSGNGAIPFDQENETAVGERFADIPISSTYLPGLLSSQSIWVLGKQRAFRWIGGTSTNGIWRNNDFGGNFNQYWSLALYAAKDMAAEIRILYEGSYAIWLDDVVVGSAPLSSSTEATHIVNLKLGWHQVIIKIRAKNTFLWVDTKGSKPTWTQANAICAENNKMQLCPRSAVCPFGEGRPGVLPLKGGSTFVPVSSHVNEWVQVAESGGDGTAFCQSWRDTHDGQGPEWGESSEGTADRSHVPCCDGSSPLSMELSITPPVDAKDQLGYTYDYPITIEAPVITVQNPAALTQLVTMTSATPGAKIKYTINNLTEEEYTVPVTIKSSSTITAKAYARDRESRSTRLFVNIALAPSFDRASCLANFPCHLVMMGVDPGTQMSVINSGMVTSVWTKYRELDYALSKEKTANFSGVIPVGKKNEIVLPPLRDGTFNVIVYGDSSTSQLVQHHLVLRNTELKPSGVIGTQHTVFRIIGGVMDGDAVLLPLNAAGSPQKCDTKACFAQLEEEKDRIAILTSNNDASFSQDLYGYGGEIKCLCICLSCSIRESGLIKTLDVSKVVGMPIDLHVLKQDVPSVESVTAVQPSTVRSGDILELHGLFNSMIVYSVVFSPVTPMAGNTVIPSCTVKKVTSARVTCEMSVRAGVMGKWNVALAHKGGSLPFGKDAIRILNILPPSPFVQSASGLCAMSSVNCVTGAQLTFHGTNFNPVGPEYTKIILNADAATNPIRCDMTTVSGTQLTCTLNIPRDKEVGVYAIGISVRASATEWGPVGSAGSLVLGAGAGERGWKADRDTSEGSKQSKVSVIVISVLGVALLVMIVAMAVLCVGRRRPPPQEEETLENYSYGDRLRFVELSEKKTEEKTAA